MRDQTPPGPPLVLPVGGSAPRVLLADGDGDGDRDLLTFGSAASRSLAAAATRLADVIEGVVRLYE